MAGSLVEGQEIKAKKSIKMATFTLKYGLRRKQWVRTYIKKLRGLNNIVASWVSYSGAMGEAVASSDDSMGFDITDIIPSKFCRDNPTESLLSEDDAVTMRVPHASFDDSICLDITDLIRMEVCRRRSPESVQSGAQTSWRSSEPMECTESSSVPSFNMYDLMICKYVARSSDGPPPEAWANSRKIRSRNWEGELSELQLCETDAAVWIVAEEETLTIEKAHIMELGMELSNFCDPEFVGTLKQISSVNPLTSAQMKRLFPNLRARSVWSGVSSCWSGAVNPSQTSASRKSRSDLSSGWPVTGSELNTFFKIPSGSGIGKQMQSQSVPVSPRLRKRVPGPPRKELITSRYAVKPAEKRRPAPPPKVTRNPIAVKPVPRKSTRLGASVGNPSAVKPAQGIRPAPLPKSPKPAPLPKSPKPAPLPKSQKPAPLPKSQKPAAKSRLAAVVAIESKRGPVQKVAKTEPKKPASKLYKVRPIKQSLPEPQVAVVHPRALQEQGCSYFDIDDYVYPTLRDLAPLGRYSLGLSKDLSLCPVEIAQTKQLVHRCETSRDLFYSRLDPTDPATKRDPKSPDTGPPLPHWTEVLDCLLILAFLLTLVFTFLMIWQSPEPAELFVSFSGMFIFAFCAYIFDMYNL